MLQQLPATLGRKNLRKILLDLEKETPYTAYIAYAGNEGIPLEGRVFLDVRLDGTIGLVSVVNLAEDYVAPKYRYVEGDLSALIEYLKHNKSNYAVGGLREYLKTTFVGEPVSTLSEALVAINYSQLDAVFVAGPKKITTNRGRKFSVDTALQGRLF